MKKILILLSFILIFSLVGCMTNNTEKGKFDKLNKLIEKEYSLVDMSVKTTKDDLTLNSSYKIKKEDASYRVTYSIEKYNELDLEGENSPSSKTVKTGELLYNGNSVTVISGEDLNLSFSYFSISKFKVDENDFSSYELLDNSFKGTIKNPNEYLQLTGISNCQLEVSFNANGVSRIKLSYDQNQYKVEVSFDLK